MLKKMMSALLVLMLACGCAGAKKEEPASNVREDDAADEAIKEETEVIPATKYGTLLSLCETVGKAAENGQWEEISRLFAEAERKNYSASEIETIFKETADGTISFLEGAPVSDEKTSGGYALFEAKSGTLEALFSVNEAYELTALKAAVRKESAQAESSLKYEETEITAGLSPEIHGILTVPSGVYDAPVAVLLPEEMDDAMNESGSNAEFRKELAHGLAENGIASVRFDMRCYEDPLLVTVFGADFGRLISMDFASIVHSLETLPVDASKIIYVGHGVSGALGYAAVVHHFEIDGGLVLLNSPYAEDGAHLFQRGAWLEEEAAKTALEAMEEEEIDENILLFGYPLSWWKKWQSLGALNYTRYVSIPILILQAENDGAVYFKKDYEDWKSQKGSNVTMKSYPDLGHDLRNKEGVFEPSIAKDIAAWVRGENINKTSTASGGKR